MTELRRPGQYLQNLLLSSSNPQCCLQLVCDRRSLKVAWTVCQIQKCLALKTEFISFIEYWFRNFHSDYSVIKFFSQDNQKGGRDVGVANLFPYCMNSPHLFSLSLLEARSPYVSNFVLLPSLFFFFLIYLDHNSMLQAWLWIVLSPVQTYMKKRVLSQKNIVLVVNTCDNYYFITCTLPWVIFFCCIRTHCSAPE